LKNLLITGDTGFIGTNLCLKLFSGFKSANHENFKIYAIDNFFSSETENLKVIRNFLNFNKISEKNFVFYNHDICYPLDYLPLDKIDLIYNLACTASPRHYQQDPIFTFKTSVWGVDNLTQLALRHQAKLIHTSTSEVYGDALIHPQNENYFGNVNTVGARSWYDEGKRASETLIYGYIKTRNLNAKIVRIFNTFGPYMDKNDGRVVSNFINQALNNKNITIYGTGKQTRSFCYIDDLLNILVTIANAQDDFYGPINIGNPNEFSVEKIAKIIIELTKSSSQIVNCPLPQDDPKQRQPDINLAQNKYKFKPQIPLEDGLKKTIEYFVQKQ